MFTIKLFVLRHKCIKNVNFKKFRKKNHHAYCHYEASFCSKVLLPTFSSIQFPCTEGCSNAFISIRRSRPAHPSQSPKARTHLQSRQGPQSPFHTLHTKPHTQSPSSCCCLPSQRRSLAAGKQHQHQHCCT